MTGKTREQLLDRMAADVPGQDGEMCRAILGIAFDYVLGEDDGEPISEEDWQTVLVAVEQERDRAVVEAGFSSIEAMEAGR